MTPDTHQEVVPFGQTQLSVDGGEKIVQHPRQRPRLHLRDTSASTDSTLLRLAEEASVAVSLSTDTTAPISGCCHVAHRVHSCVFVCACARGSSFVESRVCEQCRFRCKVACAFHHGRIRDMFTLSRS